MAFTNSDTVRLLLIGPSGNVRRVSNERNRFDDDNLLTLSFLPIEPKSVMVKGVSRTELSTATFSANGTDWLPLPFAQIVPDSVAVNGGNLLDSFFVENLDYQIDYELGRFRRIAAGAIADRTPIMLFCQVYDTFSEPDDFLVEYGTGVITRLSEGKILANEECWADYSIAQGGADDSLLDTAISLAHSQILFRLTAPYNGTSTDALLGAGEAELAASIAARTLSVQTLVTSRDSGGDDRATVWLKIAESFEQSAWKKLQPFIAAPQKRSGYAVKNAG